MPYDNVIHHTGLYVQYRFKSMTLEACPGYHFANTDFGLTYVIEKNVAVTAREITCLEKTPVF